MTTNTPNAHEPLPANTAEVLQQTLLSGYVLNVNLLMQQMVANQHSLQQILTASTAKAVAEITSPGSRNDSSVIQNVDIVLKSIQESSSGYIHLIKQLTVEAENALKMVNR